MGSIDSVDLQFRDELKRVKGAMRIYSDRGRNLFEITPHEAEEYGEEPVQLVEGCSYEYRLLNISHGLTLADASNVTPSRSEPTISGRIETGNSSGLLSLFLQNQQGNRVASAFVEVRSAKISYRDDYRHMLDYIAEKCNSLLLDIQSSVHLKLSPDSRLDIETIQQRYAFLRAILNSTEFKESVNRVTTVPHSTLIEEQVTQSIRQRFVPTSHSVRQLSYGSRRTLIPADHPLNAKMAFSGVEHITVPQTIVNTKKIDTRDNPENRFVKYCLGTFRNYLTEIEAILQSKTSQTAIRVLKEVQSDRNVLEEILSHDFFHGIGETTFLPLGSPVLQRKGGYREILQAWLKFNLAAHLIWQGGLDVFGAGKKDLPILYEYWLFFNLVDLIAEKFNLANPPVSELVQTGSGGLYLGLKSGRQLNIDGSTSQGLRVRFSYNRTFESSSHWISEGSWTRRMRPDYTLSLWPSDKTADEAERDESMVHLHFDAKYRVDSLDSLFGAEQYSLDTESVSERNGVYKRADLLKMHAYRDAIKRTQGAYILYPGTENKIWRMGHHILPGIGAFAIRPDKEGKPTGIGSLSTFLDSVLEYLTQEVKYPT